LHSKNTCSTAASKEKSERNTVSDGNEHFPLFDSTPTPTRASWTSSLSLTDFEVTSESNDSTDDDQCLSMPDSTPTPTQAFWTTAYGSITDRFGMQADPLPTLMSKMTPVLSMQSATFIQCDTVVKKASSMLKHATPSVPTPPVPTPPVPNAGKDAPDTLSEELKVACQELPSIGSIAHQRGTCKPCAFGANCRNGTTCEFCHICVAPQKTKGGRWILKRRKKTQELHNDMLNLHVGKKHLQTSRRKKEGLGL
jgi:hypothetical protein